MANHTQLKYPSFLIVFSLLYSLSLNGYTYLFSHGFGSTYKQAYRYTQTYNWLGKTYKNKNHILYKPIKLFNYPDAFYQGLPPKVNLTSLAQKNEIETLRKAYNEINDNNIILFGTSRGASTAINFAGIYQPNKVKASIVEAPFDHINNVFNSHWFVNILSTVINKAKIYNLFLWATQYKETGEHPIDKIVNIKKDLPVLLVCSETDATVPCDSTVNLYKNLKQTGHKHTYLLKFESGGHSRLLWSKHGRKFRNIVHAFYAKYNLPHIPSFAKQGKKYFEQECQPTIQALNKTT